MKKVIALLTAIALLGAFTGCHSTEPSGTDTEVPGATLEVNLSHSYAGKQILKDAATTLSFSRSVQFGDKVLTSGYDEEQNYLFLLDPNTEELIEKPLGLTQVAGMDVQRDTVDVFLRHRNEDWTETWLELVTYDSSLNEIQSEDVTEKWSGLESVHTWARDAQGNSYFGILGEGIYCMTEDGEPHKIEGTAGNEDMFCGCDGRVYGISANNSRSVDVYHPDTLTKEKMDIELPDNGFNDTHILHGNAQYEYLCYTDEALFGVSVADRSVTELLNWEESDFDAAYVGSSTHLLPDGRVLLNEYNYSNDMLTDWLLTARTQEEMDAMTLISMASTSDSGGELVHLYNRQAEGHRIVLKSYRDDTSDDLGRSALERDLLDGVVPDILMGSGNYQILSNKGLFEDLSTWMENDPDFHEEDYLMNYFESMRYKGRLERISFRFVVSAWMAKTEFLDGKTALTLEDYNALDLPEGMQLLGCNTERETAFQALVANQLGTLVDYENGTCSFDTPEFAQLLELFEALPKRRAVEDAYAFEENRALLLQANLMSLIDYKSYIQTFFGNADVTLTGIPLGAEGSGGIFYPVGEEVLMSASSQHKEEVWQFIKFCLSQENQMQNTSDRTSGFPVRLDALEAAMERDQQPTEEHNSFGRVYGNDTILIMPASAEEAEELLTYIKGITMSAYQDETVKNIVYEEAGKYFAGDCTAEEAAKMMQSRAGIYLAEQS